MSDFSNIYEIHSVKNVDVKHVVLRLNKGWDVIRITYTDNGFIQIFSSFGHYAYHWTAMGEGVTLQQFFGERASGDNHYLANKLWDHRFPQKVFDLDLAKKEIKQYLEEESYLDKDEIDEIIDKMNYNIDDFNSKDIFIHQWMCCPELNEAIPDIYEHSFGMDNCGRYKCLLNDVVPTVQKFFRGELKEYEQQA